MADANHEAKLADSQGRDLLYFKDAKSLAEDSDRFFRKRRDELLRAQAGREPGKKGAPGQAPPPPASMTFPERLRHSADGVGEFLNPGEGAEMLFGFDFLWIAGKSRNLPDPGRAERPARIHPGGRNQPGFCQAGIAGLFPGGDSGRIRPAGRGAGVLAGVAAPPLERGALPDPLSVVFRNSTQAGDIAKNDSETNSLKL
ncbi:MAG: hypothetical protein LBU64_14715 [Planctomycetota bacterium]|nr:hypothetical protein [Planctomycetota bacterium]